MENVWEDLAIGAKKTKHIKTRQLLISGKIKKQNYSKYQCSAVNDVDRHNTINTEYLLL